MEILGRIFQLSILFTMIDIICTETIDSYSCNFDASLCNWTHNTSYAFIWTRTSHPTPSMNTGPSGNLSGTGSYIYIEASSPRKVGDTARLISPIIQGPHCMSFMYHMYGRTMGSIIVYIKSNLTSTLKPVWVKSRNQFNKWRQANIYIDEEDRYQIYLDGVRGSTWEGDAAIDDIKFVKGKCQNLKHQLIHVYFKEESNMFKLDTAPLYDAWTYEFSFYARQTKNDNADSLYFIYSEGKCTKRLLSKKLPLTNKGCIPFEFLYVSKKSNTGTSKIMLLDKVNESQGIALEGHGKCCGENVMDYFYANSSVEDLSICPPGWTLIGNMCYQYVFANVVWNDARMSCIARGGKIATPSLLSTMKNLSNYLNKLHFPFATEAFVGAATLDRHWEWLSGTRVSSKFWGPGQPSGDGECGNLIKGEEWDFKWHGHGWKLNDEHCEVQSNFLCQKKFTRNRTCENGWFVINNNCYALYAVHKTWENARLWCQGKGGLLATLDSDSTMSAMIATLNKISYFRGNNAKVFVGLTTVGQYQWVTGQPVANYLWHGGATAKYSSMKCGAVKPAYGRWRMIQFNCNHFLINYICQMEKHNKAYLRKAETNSSVSIGRPSFAVDGRYATCFQTRKENSPWIRMQLGKEMFVFKLQIIIRRRCCLERNSKLRVLLGQEGVTPAKCSIYHNVYQSTSELLVCDASRKGDSLVLQAFDSNTVLSLCEVIVYGSDNVQEFQGVFQELWFGISSNYLSNLRLNPRFPLRPDTVSTIKNFDAPYDTSMNYGQRLSAYLHVPTSGNYTFYVACNNECELSIKRVDAFNGTMNKSMQNEDDDSTPTLLKLFFQKFTGHNEFFRYPSGQSSSPVALSKCQLYKVILVMKQGIGQDCASVGMKLPDGTFEGPIPAKRLYFVKPGTRDIHFVFEDRQNRIIVEAGTKGFIIKATYKHCCHGVYCPDCRVRLRFHALDMNFTVKEFLDMDCKSRNFTAQFDILQQPRDYFMTIRYSFWHGLEEMTEHMVVGTLKVLPKIYLACNFTKDMCSWKEISGWNLTRSPHDFQDGGRPPSSFLSLNHQRKGLLESEWLLKRNVLKTLGFCLRFRFLLPTITTSQLQVLLKTRDNQNETLLWSIRGHQGSNWIDGQVSWQPVENDFKILFLGSSVSNITIAIGLDTITLESADCPRLPKHSYPDYKCQQDNQFQCANGICINKDLVCDGDPFCIDGSDEKSCKCLSSQFSCTSGECITSSQLCNGIKDCEDGSDESQCKKICSKDDFQCLSGSCVPWSQTCDSHYQCEDQTDEPEICGLASCPLNNQSCMGSENTTEPHECASRKVECDFERGPCGLTHDKEGSFQWLRHSGPTPTKGTGPNYDHTNMNNKGKYMYIEASDRRTGEKALLSSDLIEGGHPVCVQFWYHMYGIDTGSLNIYTKMNISEDLRWSRSGNMGAKWLFGQVGYYSQNTHRIILEGVIGSGPRGDIAVDDLSISFDSCATLGESIDFLGCTFGRDPCSWKASGFWHVHSSVNVIHKLDNVYQSDGYLFLLPSRNHLPMWEKLVSPVVKSRYETRCLKFWYRLVLRGKTNIGIKVSIDIQNITTELWNWEEETNGWQYAQIPLNHLQDYQVIIEGKTESSKSPKVAIDDIVFSKETCDIIPRYVDPPEVFKESFGAIKHWKLDGGDNDVMSVGAVTYRKDRGRFITCLDGKTAYLETPAVDIRSSSFSITCWVMITDTGVMNHIYSDWTDPYQFRLYVNQGALNAELRGKGYVNTLVHLSVTLSTTNGWKHVAFVWNRESRTAYLYENAVLRTFGSISSSIKDIDLQLTNHGYYEIGAKKDTKHFLRGCLRDVVIFDRALDYHTIRLLYSPSREACAIRSTTTGDCCAFPFMFQNQIYDTCIYRQSRFICGTASKEKFGKCTVNEECGIVKDNWCGWKNVFSRGSKWKRLTTNDTINILSETATKMSATSIKPDDYEVNFVDNHTGYINYTGLPDMTSFTICMWLKTNDTQHAGTPFVYRVHSRDVAKDFIAIGLFDYRNIYIIVGRSISVRTKIALNDSVWHHICLRWNSNVGAIAMSTDGVQIGGSSFGRGVVIPGNGEFIIGATSSYARTVGNHVGQFVGTVSDINIWTYMLSYKDVRLMSLGCGGRPLTKSFINWELLKDYFVKNLSVRKPATCKNKKGVSVMMRSNKATESGITSSRYTSPVFRSSHLSYGQCLRFRYLIYGSGTRELHIFQHLKVDNFAKRLVWFVNVTNDTDPQWSYGKAAISGVSEYKISLEGSQRTEPGYMMVKGINVADGYCETVPTNADKVCLKLFSNSSGVLHSPFYPGYYSTNTHCTWHITVEQSHFIRMYFLSFDLEDYPMCQSDYVSVYDVNKRKRIGRYCGTRYPHFVDSSGNKVIVVFKSDHSIIRTGFKAHYKAIPSLEKHSITNETCTSYKGCPVNCECNLISSDPESLMVTTRHGKTLTSIPSDLPENTRALMLRNNRIDRLPADAFNENSKNIEYLDLSNNIVMDIHGSALQNLKRLKTLRLNSNFLVSLSGKTYNDLTHLTSLDLSNNLLKEIPPTLLSSLVSLSSLSLRSNRLTSIGSAAFKNNTNLTSLYINFNELKEIPDDLLRNLKHINILDLSHNRIKEFSAIMFQGLSSLKKLYLQKNFPIRLSPDIFGSLTSLKELHVDEFFFCCYAKKAIQDVRCISPKDFFSSCSDLMKNKTLQIFIWILGLSALLGNAFVVILRLGFKEDNKVHSFLLTNLAVADFLMGVYMLILAIKDVTLQGEYFKHDFTWRTGITCKFAGALSLLSSEVSVLLLTLITADRFKSIVFPFRFGKLRFKGACGVVTLIWIIGLILSIVPVLSFSYFYDESRRVGYYGRSALCLPLQLTKDKLAGWEYSVMIFIVLNLISFTFILLAYILMFITVKRISSSVRSTVINRESQMAKRMAFIIATDFCCWMPVIIIGILSLLDLFHDPEQQVYAWLAVFVLPVNSSINPVLYTFSTPLLQNRLKLNQKLKERWLSRTFLTTPSNVVPSNRLHAGSSVIGSTINSTLLGYTNLVALSSSLDLPKEINSNNLNSSTTQESPTSIHTPSVLNNMKLRLVEISDVCKDDKQNSSAGFVLAWIEGVPGEISLRLVKHMPRKEMQAWKKEAAIVSSLSSSGKHPNIMKYCWHAIASEINIQCNNDTLPELKPNALLICYDFVSSTSLEDYLKDSQTTMNVDSLCTIALDVINALEELHRQGVVHNNIRPSNILIGRCLRFPPILAVLGGFSMAEKAALGKSSGKYDALSNSDHRLSNNIHQFGKLLSTMIDHCEDSSNNRINIEIQSVMELCVDQAFVKLITPSHIKELLMDIWCTTEVWDTYL